MNRTFYARFVKRVFDIVISLIGIILSAPILILVSILVRIKLGSPVIFSQKRPGLNEKIFKMYKFRTMTDSRDENGQLLPDEDRLTGFGKVLRATSIDELPELFNIIRGDMSFIGPRPLLVEYLDLYTDEEKRRHDIRPGLTGWAQVNGRNAISWEERFKLDVKYVDNISMAFDIKIFLKTIYKVVRSEDISSATSITMEKYKGR